MAKGNGWVSCSQTDGAIDQEKHEAAVALLKEAGYGTVNASFTAVEPLVEGQPAAPANPNDRPAESV